MPDAGVPHNAPPARFRLSVVIPAYNEEAVIEGTLRGLIATLSHVTQGSAWRRKLHRNFKQLGPASGRQFQVQAVLARLAASDHDCLLSDREARLKRGAAVR